MEKEIDFRVKQPIPTWQNENTFIDDATRTVGEVYDEAAQKVRETKEAVVEQTKTIAPDVVEKVEETTRKVNAGKQIIPGIKNSYLVWGGAAVLVYWLLTK